MPEAKMITTKMDKQYVSQCEVQFALKMEPIIQK